MVMADEIMMAMRKSMPSRMPKVVPNAARMPEVQSSSPSIAGQYMMEPSFSP